MLDSKDHAHPKRPAEYLRLILTGFAMGAADLVPGVSGGTMAFILGVYADLIDGIKSFNFEALRLALARRFNELFNEHIPIRFLIALGIGIGTAIFTLARVLSATLNDPTGRVYLFGFFFGLVLASILAIGVKIKWSPVTFVTLIAGTVIAFVIVNLAPVEVAPTPLNLLFAGMIAICAMILPGISGSFILLIMGQYDNVLTAVSNHDYVTVGIVAVGCAIGIVIFSRVLSWLLHHAYHPTVAALVGFMVGSLWKIWPWKECTDYGVDLHNEARCLIERNLMPGGESSLALVIALLVGGFLLVNFLDHLQSGSNPLFSLLWRRTDSAEIEAA